MIPKLLLTNLNKCMLKIGARQNEGGQLSINEWDFNNEDDEEIDVTPGFTHYKAKIVVIIERNDIRKVVEKSEFFNNLKQYFVVTDVRLNETDNKRYRLNMTLAQAVCTA